MAWRWIVPLLALALLAPGRPEAAVRADMVPPFITGVDAGAGPDTPLTNTVNAEMRYAAKVGASAIPSVNFANVEMPLFGGPIQLSPHIQLITSNLDFHAPAEYQFGISTLSNANTIANNKLVGFNVGGEAQHFVVAPTLGTALTTLTFVSDTPFNGFGFYLTGFGNIPTTSLTVEYAGPTGQVSDPVQGSLQGGALFFGVFDPTASMTQFQIQVRSTSPSTSRDVFGISDVQFAAAAVPEPASAALVLVGVGGLAGLGMCRGRRG